MMKYDSFKDSEVDWLGEIPSSWQVLRVKDITKKIGSGVTPKGGSEVYVDSGIPLLRSQNVYDDGLRIDDVSFIDEETHQKMKNSQLKPFDILINITGASIGRTCIVPESLPAANINQHIIFIRMKKSSVFYASYYFKSNALKEYINLIQAGSSKEALNMGQTLSTPIILPSHDEQIAIANYLDGKTQAIDKKVSLLEKKIGYYQELRKSLINETVTKGLDKNAKLKESRIDLGDLHWIKRIPEYWSIQRLDWIAHLIRGNTGFGKDELLDSGEYVALQYGKTYQVDEVNSSFQYFVNREFYKQTQIVNRGDTILISTSETIEDLGHSCFYNRDDLGLVGGEQILLKPNRKIVVGKYLYYCSKEFATELRKNATGLKVFRFNIDDLKQIFVAIPPLEEQIQIANYLTEKTSRIDQIITIMQTQITTLKELRKTLVNDVVTGKIKVTND